MKDIKYRLAEDTITQEDLKALADWLTSNPTPQLTMGPLVKAYEKKWSDWVGRQHSVACNSGSSANLLMAYALLISGQLKNKKVIVPSTAWVTSITPFIQLGFEPIMCESDTQNWGLDLSHLEELLQKHQPSTVMLVQVLGVPALMDELKELEKKYDFFLLEDACAAVGSSYHSKKVGTFGKMSSVSTYYGHQFSTLEGGIVSTDDSEFYNLLLMLRSHGWTAQLDSKTRLDLLQKYSIKDIGTDFVFCEPGFNFRLTDLQAFLGLRQLDRMNWLVQRRFTNHKLYKKLLAGHLEIQQYDNQTVVCSIHFCALAKNYQQRNALLQKLEETGIETRPFTSGNQGRQPYWFKKYGEFNEFMADQLYYRGFFLPNHPYLEPEDIVSICRTVLKSIEV